MRAQPLSKPTSKAPAQAKGQGVMALRPCRRLLGGLPNVPRRCGPRAATFCEGLLHPSQRAVLEPQPEAVGQRRGIRCEVLHSQVHKVVGCLEAVLSSNVDRSETNRRWGITVFGTRAVSEEPIPIGDERHRHIPTWK